METINRVVKTDVVGSDITLDGVKVGTVGKKLERESKDKVDAQGNPEIIVGYLNNYDEEGKKHIKTRVTNLLTQVNPDLKKPTKANPNKLYSLSVIADKMGIALGTIQSIMGIEAKKRETTAEQALDKLREVAKTMPDVNFTVQIEEAEVAVEKEKYGEVYAKALLYSGKLPKQLRDKLQEELQAA